MTFTHATFYTFLRRWVLQLLDRCVVLGLLRLGGGAAGDIGTRCNSARSRSLPTPDIDIRWLEIWGWGNNLPSCRLAYMYDILWLQPAVDYTPIAPPALETSCWRLGI